jgi:hypothetical protein
MGKCGNTKEKYYSVETEISKENTGNFLLVFFIGS